MRILLQPVLHIMKIQRILCLKSTDLILWLNLWLSIIEWKLNPLTDPE